MGRWCEAYMEDAHVWGRRCRRGRTLSPVLCPKGQLCICCQGKGSLPRMLELILKKARKNAIRIRESLGRGKGR